MAPTSVRWKPPDAITITHKQKLGVVYIYRDDSGRRAAIGYAGRASRPTFQFTYDDESTAARRIEAFFRDLSAFQHATPNSRSHHSFKVDDVVSYSWIHQQINVEWFRVVRIAPRHVWLQPICGEIRPSGNAGGDSAPLINTTSDNPAHWGFTDREAPVEKHRASGDFITMKYGQARKWDGSPVYASWNV